MHKSQEVIKKNNDKFGMVMTHPGYRGRGLATKLMNAVLEEYEKQCSLIFLFGEKSLKDFYSGFGFDQVSETRFYANPSL